MPYYWSDYEAGKPDGAGHTIHSILAKCPDYVIYFCEESQPGRFSLYYECTDMLLESMGIPDAALAKINRLLPEKLDERTEILELVADAFEMWLCNSRVQSQAILDDIVSQLKTTREGQGRLLYQGAAMALAGFIWIFYLCLHGTQMMPTNWEIWVLAAALGSAGGVLSVCINLGKISVNVNQSSKFLASAGRTRAIVAIIGGMALLLAMRAKMILDVDPSQNTGVESLTMFEMFFCFLAGFSETFVANVLRDAEKKNPATNE